MATCDKSRAEVLWPRRQRRSVAPTFCAMRLARVAFCFGGRCKDDPLGRKCSLASTPRCALCTRMRKWLAFTVEREGEGHIRRGEREYGFRNARRSSDSHAQWCTDWPAPGINLRTVVAIRVSCREAHARACLSSMDVFCSSAQRCQRAYVDCTGARTRLRAYVGCTGAHACRRTYVDSTGARRQTGAHM